MFCQCLSAVDVKLTTLECAAWRQFPSGSHGGFLGSCCATVFRNDALPCRQKNNMSSRVHHRECVAWSVSLCAESRVRICVDLAAVNLVCAITTSSDFPEILAARSVLLTLVMRTLCLGLAGCRRRGRGRHFQVHSRRCLRLRAACMRMVSVCSVCTWLAFFLFVGMCGAAARLRGTCRCFVWVPVMMQWLSGWCPGAVAFAKARSVGEW